MLDEMQPIPLSVSRFHVHVRFISGGRISLNFANTLRGGFGAALRETVCGFPGRPCVECPLSDECAYGYVFETVIPKRTEIMRKYPYAPHPFMLNPPTGLMFVKGGDTAAIGITLIGRASTYLPHVFFAFKELGIRGVGSSRIQFEIIRLENEDDNILYSENDHKLREMRSERLFSIAPGPSEEGIFTLRFETPLRLQSGGRIKRRPDFHDIIASLMRRISLLSYFHCGGNGNAAGAAFLDHTARVETIDEETRAFRKERFSVRQRQKVPMNGFTGELTFSGDYGFFMPLLKAGEYVYIGKDTIFGFGKFITEVEV